MLNFELNEYLECCTECAFYIVSETFDVGFKLFYAKEDAEYSHQNQLICWRNGVGSKPGKKLISYKGYWGYLVQVVELLHSRKGFDLYCSKEMDDLRKKFNEVLGFPPFDDHEENVGIDKNGRLVFIDFGRHMDKRTPFKYYDEKQFDFMRK